MIERTVIGSDPRARVVVERSTAPTAATRRWGLFPVLSVVSAGGLLGLSLADTAARNGSAWAQPLFWLSLLVLFVPVSARLAMPGPSRWERICLIGLLGVALYLVKVLNSPLYFTGFDELSNWRTADDVLRSHHLFLANPLESINPRFPALAIVTSTLASISGLSLFAAGTIVIGAAKIVMVLALYLFYETISHAPRLAGIAALLYMANPGFVFFDAQFAYESLALPLAVLTLLVVARRERAGRGPRVGWFLVAALILCAVVVAHHLTSYFLTAFLLLWAVAALSTGPRPRASLGPASVALLALAAIAAWTVGVASDVLGYIGGPFSEAIDSVGALITGQSPAKRLNAGYAGPGTAEPAWTQAISYGSVLLILLSLPIGLWRVWLRRRRDPVVLVLTLLAAVYPLSLVLRFTQGGTEISSRSSELLFLGVAFLLALGCTYAWRRRQPPRWRPVAFSVWATIIFLGGLIIGWGPTARLPGPYIVAADARSVDAEGIDAALWARANLQPTSRILTDRTNRQLMGSYGDLDPQVGAAAGHDISLVFFLPQFGETAREISRVDAIRYLVVDRRLSQGLPVGGVYFGAEPGAYKHTVPIPLGALTKFDQAPGVSRIFDSGDIVIYDVGNVGDCSRMAGGHSRCVDRMSGAGRANQ